MTEPRHYFPRWCVSWRAYYSTEATLGRLPVVLLVPTLAALVGAAWATTHPADVIRHGLVVRQASFAEVLATALVGGLVGLGLLVGLAFAASLAWYRVAGDRVWRVEWMLSYHEDPRGITSSASGVSLHCKTNPPINVSSLGHVEAVVRMPTGAFLTMPQHGMGGTPTSLGFSPTGGGRPPDGTYEVRWYATGQTRRLQELARSRITFHAES